MACAVESGTFCRTISDAKAPEAVKKRVQHVATQTLPKEFSVRIISIPATKIIGCLGFSRNENLSQLQLFRAKSSGKEWHRSEAVGEFFLAIIYTLFRQMDEPEHDSAAVWSGTDRNE